MLPVWVIAGFLDYLCHRRSHIEQATGAREPLIHWLMLAEVMVPLSLAVFFRINALVLAVMLVCLIAHQVTGYLDLKLAMATRRPIDWISPMNTCPMAPLPSVSISL